MRYAKRPGHTLEEVSLWAAVKKCGADRNKHGPKATGHSMSGRPKMGYAESGTEEWRKTRSNQAGFSLSVSSLPTLISSLFPSPFLSFSLFFSLPLRFPLFPPPTFSGPSLSLSHSFLDTHYTSLKSQGQHLTGDAMAQPGGPINHST